MHLFDEFILSKYRNKLSYQKEKLWPRAAFSKLSFKKKKKGEDGAERVKHEALLAPTHVFKQLRFTSNKADSAVTNRKSKKKKSIAHSMQTQLCD